MEMSPKLRPIVEEAQRSPLYRKNVARIAKPLTSEGEVQTLRTDGYHRTASELKNNNYQ